MQNLLLLHGALGAAAQFAPLQEQLEKHFTLHTLNFAGHGGEPFPQGGYSIQVFAQNVLDYLDQQGIEQIDIFGYSMGGYVALYLAQQHPDRIGKIYTLATKFAWSPESAEQEMKMLNPEKIAEKVPKFAAALEQRHAPQDWKEVLNQTAAMMRGLGEAPLLTEEGLEAIPHTCLITVGDQDQMVSREETMAAANTLPKAEFACMAETPHPLEQVNVERLAKWIREFMS